MLKKILFIASLLITFSLGGVAQNVTFNGSAPEVVGLGEQFRLTYKINKSGKNFTLSANHNFDILMGPSTSTSISTQIINRKVKTEKKISYSYILVANKIGRFTIPPAKISIKGKQYNSNAITIKVVKTNQNPPPPVANKQKTTAKPTISTDRGNNFFIRILLSKRNLFKGEHLIATIKIYSKYDQLGNLTFQPPTFANFLSQEIKSSQAIKFKRETYKGSIYNTAILSRYVLFPQKIGKITIGAASVDCVVRQIVSTGDFFDDFFGRNYKDLKISKKSSATKINVKDLPQANKPLNFSNGVGDFKLKASINKDSIKANEAITLNVKISGNGNLKLLNPVKFNFPNDFEVYDPEKTQRIRNSYAGTKGYISYKYLLIPRFAGNYKIPSTTFSFFNPKTKTYKQLSTPKFTINVTKGKQDTNMANITSFSKEDITFLGRDIRFLNTNKLKLFNKNLFFGTKSFYLFYITSFGIFLLLILIYRKALKNAQNFTKQKYKHASRIARKRLQKAKNSLKKYDEDTFFDNLLSALWGYTSDKFNIPMAKLSKDNILEYLTKNKISETTKIKFVNLLNHSEYAQYSPDPKEKEMNKLYSEAVELISRVESELKN